MRTKNLSILFASLFVIAGAVFGIGARAEGEVPAPPAIGATIDDFTLPDVDNKDRSLKSLAGKNGTVLIFIAVQCPVSNAYNERMEKLTADYKAKGIAVVGINSNVAEDAAAVKAHAAEHSLSFPILKDPGNKIAAKLGASLPSAPEAAPAVKPRAAEHSLSFPILKDPGNKIADKLGASVTPEAYFLDASNKLLYHGRIDNSRNAAQIETSDLRNALDAALNGKPVEKTEARAFGCSIKRG